MAGLRKTFEFLSRSLFITHSHSRTIGQRERVCTSVRVRMERKCVCVQNREKERKNQNLLSLRLFRECRNI